jgi:hypothetical protein
MNWKEVPLPALQTLLSTGEAQPLPPETWPAWGRTTPGFSGAWFSHVGGLPATSTGTLSTGNIHGYVDMERTSSEPPTLRYYRYLYVKMTDGRVFQAGPFKDLEYERRREERPPWLASYISTSTSTG